jgi:hypothetical protein
MIKSWILDVKLGKLLLIDSYVLGWLTSISGHASIEFAFDINIFKLKIIKGNVHAI